MSNTELVMRIPRQAQQPPVQINVEHSDYKNCKPVLDGGCNVSFCPKDFYLDPLCNYPGITGMISDDVPCILYDGQLDKECVGCNKDCGTMGYCPINIGGLY